MVEVLTPAEVALLTPAEAEIYQGILEEALARRSPLDLACLMFPETRRWEHLELLNDYLVALTEYRLTADGPVPKDNVCWWYISEGDPEQTKHASSGPHSIPEQIDDFGAYDRVTGAPVVFRLGISMRPRAGKSRLVTETFPYWLEILSGGTLQIGVGTYSDTFAADWGGMARDFAMLYSQSHDWFPTPQGGLRAPKDIFSLREGGKVRYVGVGGGITGKTLHVLIGDDFLKNSAEAESEATRKQSHQFYDRTWKTRKTRDHSPEAILPIPIEVLMATRWHQDDVTGHACYDEDTREPRNDWCILNIPSLSKGDGDPLGRPEGQAHPNAAGETRADLERLRSDDPRGFAALYQGEPSPEGGGLIPANLGTYHINDGQVIFRAKDDEDPERPPSLYAVPLEDLVRFASVDVAATTKTAADYTVAFACGYSRQYRKLFILARYKGKITTDKYMSELVPFFEDNKCFTVLCENITYGQTFRQQLELERKAGNKRFSLADMPKHQDKVARVVTSTLPAMMRHNDILAARDAPFREDLLSDVGLFPFAAHDDQVDALAFAAQYCLDLPSFTKRKERLVPTLQDELDSHVEKDHKRRNGKSRGSDLWSYIGR